MTIDLYPEIIRQEDLSPDSGFGGDIDEDCQVRQRVVVMFCRKRSGLLICMLLLLSFLSLLFSFFFCSSNTKHNTKHTHTRSFTMPPRVGVPTPKRSLIRWRPRTLRIVTCFPNDTKSSSKTSWWTL